MENSNQQDNAAHLFASDGLGFFHRHGVASLVAARNNNIGALLTSDRALFYLNILYRMLLYKRDYELEPLYDDIFNGVHAAQTASSGDEYSTNQFRTDLAQLASWALVNFRIEKQRLRGYRDNRKRKFRYRLETEAVSFLEWLEDRCLDDMQSRGNDTRDLLGETRGSLGELLRLLHSFKPESDIQGDTARRVLFQLFKAADLSQEITVSLADLNGRLLFFLVQHYQIDEVRRLIREIEAYVDTFLKQTYRLRVEIVPLLERLMMPHNRDKIGQCQQIMETERRKTPNLMRVRRNVQSGAIPESLHSFFAEQGGLDRLLQRINTSSLKVWQKLRSHLRELERKNNRLQDIRHRIEELASLPDETRPASFMNELLSQPLNRFDPNYWDNLEKAEPPAPRRPIARQTNFPKQFLSRKKSRGTAVESMDEARLRQLEHWIEEKLPLDPQNRARLLSRLTPDRFADFTQIIELARAGLLNDGKWLARISYHLTPHEQRIVLAAADQQLDCPELAVTQEPPSPKKP